MEIGDKFFFRDYTDQIISTKSIIILHCNKQLLNCYRCGIILTDFIDYNDDIILCSVFPYTKLRRQTVTTDNITERELCAIIF